MIYTIENNQDNVGSWKHNVLGTINRYLKGEIDYQ